MESILYANMASYFHHFNSLFNKILNFTYRIPSITSVPLKESNPVSQLHIISQRLTQLNNYGIPSAVHLLSTLINWIEAIQPTYLTCALSHSILDVHVITVNPFMFSPKEYNICGVKINNLFFVQNVDYPVKIKGIFNLQTLHVIYLVKKNIFF